MGGKAEHRRPPLSAASITVLPTTYLGRWAVGLLVLFVGLLLGSSTVPHGAALALACGIAGGIAVLVAVIRDRERGVTAFVAFVPLAIALGFLVAELLTGS